jgi:predicted DNA-binding ribbon-helix-helix protein
MARTKYTVELEDKYVANLERIAREAGASPGELLMELAPLDAREVQSSMAVATADGYKRVITGGTRDIT